MQISGGHFQHNLHTDNIITNTFGMHTAAMLLILTPEINSY